LFEGFSREQANLLRARFTVVGFKAGETFICAGDPGDCLYLISAGEVEVRAPQTADAPAKVLARLGPGHVVGEMALLNREPRNADCVALTDCMLDRLSAEDYEEVSAQVPVLKLVLTRLVAHRFSWSGSDVLARRIGPYTVIAPIGQGGMAWVYRAVREIVEPGAGRRQVVALKMLPHERVMQPGFLEKFRQESAVMTGLRHENIVSLFDTIEVYGTIFLALEFVPGISVREWFESRGKLPADQVREIAWSVIQALRAAHARGIIHRDVKPDNVMLRDDGVVKLMDFGIAVPISGPAITLGGVSLTPAYSAPEIFTGARGDPASDFYSLGIMLYELLTGERPFKAENYKEMAHEHLAIPPKPLRRLCPDAPADLEDFINVALVKDPVSRWVRLVPLLEKFSRVPVAAPLAPSSEESVALAVVPPPQTPAPVTAASAIASTAEAATAVAQKIAGAPPSTKPGPSGMMALWIRLPGETRERVFLMVKPLTVGRDETADIRVTDTAMSRFHAELSPAAGGGLHVHDLNSSNGTFVNDEPISDADLRRGDRLRVGHTIFTYESETATGIHLSAATAQEPPSPPATLDSGAL